MKYGPAEGELAAVARACQPVVGRLDGAAPVGALKVHRQVCALYRAPNVHGRVEWRPGEDGRAVFVEIDELHHEPVTLDGEWGRTKGGATSEHDRRATQQQNAKIASVHGRPRVNGGSE